MKVEEIEYLDRGYRTDLLGRLRGQVFHLTTVEALEAIRKTGAILHNRDGRFPINLASKHSFGREKGWVCLFDLRDPNEELLQNTLEKKYDFLGPSWFRNCTDDFVEWKLAYLFLDRSAWAGLVENDAAKEEGPREHYLPEIEVWVPDKIPLEFIDKALHVKICIEDPKDSFSSHSSTRARQSKSGEWGTP